MDDLLLYDYPLSKQFLFNVHYGRLLSRLKHFCIFLENIKQTYVIRQLFIGNYILASLGHRIQFAILTLDLDMLICQQPSIHLKNVTVIHTS